MNIFYRLATEQDRSTLAGLIAALYEEDPSEQGMTAEKISRTIDTLLNHPEKGKIVVFKHSQKIIGYSIIFHFWSNEFGGEIIFIDELYVKKDVRGQGIATNFIRSLLEKSDKQTVAIMLEVTPDNTKAQKLYKKIGFQRRKNYTFTLSVQS